MKKKVIAIVICAVLVVGTAAGFLIHHFTAKKPADIHDTPLPATISTEEAGTIPKKLEEVELSDLPKIDEFDKSNLLGKTYRSIVHRSEKTFTDKDGIVYDEEKFTEYYGDTDGLLYTAISHRTCTDLYGADGVLLYSSGDYTPDVQYDAEPLRWFFKDGVLVCGELFFTDLDSGNLGAAYYDAEGNLLCLFTEIYNTNEGGHVSVERTYYNAAFETIEKSEYDALIPAMDAPQFLYENWA